MMVGNGWETAYGEAFGRLVFWMSDLDVKT